MIKSEDNLTLLNMNGIPKKTIKRSNIIKNENISDTKINKKTNMLIIGNDESIFQETNRNSKRHTNLKLNLDNFSRADQMFLISNERQRVEDLLRDKLFKKSTLVKKQKSPLGKFHSDKEIIPYKKLNTKSASLPKNTDFKLNLPFSSLQSNNQFHEENQEEVHEIPRKLKTNKLPYVEKRIKSKNKEKTIINYSKNENSNNLSSNFEDLKDSSIKQNETKNQFVNVNYLKTKKFNLKSNIFSSDVHKNLNYSSYVTNLISEENDKNEKNYKTKESRINISQEMNRVYRSKTESDLTKKKTKRKDVIKANTQNPNEKNKENEYKIEIVEENSPSKNEINQETGIRQRVKLKRSKTAFTCIKKKYQSDENFQSDSDEVTETLISLNLDKYKLNKIQEEIRSNMFPLNLNNITNYKEDSKTSNNFRNLEDSLKLLKKNAKDEEEETVEQENFIKEKKYRYIIRKGLIYDSLSDEENDQMEDNNFVIHQDSHFLFYFELLIFIAGIYSVIFTPIYLAFFYTLPQKFSDISFIIEIIIDILLLAEIFINFFVTYLDFEEKLIINRKMIISNYLYTWFTVDVISAIPFHTYLFSYNIFSNMNSKNLMKLEQIKYLLKSQEYQSSQFLIIFRLFKLIKIFKSNHFLNFINYRFFEDFNIKATLERLIEFLLYYLMITHILTCIFIFLGYLDTPNWIIMANLQESSSFDIYIASIYFNWTTIFTIGYGDIHAYSIYERFYSVILLMIGVLVYSYAVSSLANFIQEKSEKEQIFEKNMSCLERISIKYKLKNKLYKKIERFLKFNMTNNKIQETELLNSLPTALKNEMILRIFKPIIKNFIFFKYVSNSSVDFTIKAIMCLRPISAVKDERLVNEGEFIDEIIFVKMGALVLEVGLLVITKQDEHESKSKRKELLKQTREVQDELNYETIKSIKITMTPRSKMAQSVVNSNADSNNLNMYEYYDKEYLKIIELRRNEHFGDILMFLNKRSPLSVRVKTKTAELFTMKKTDVVNISMNYPNIFEKICRNSIFNHKQLEILIKRTKLLFYQQHKENFKVGNERSLKKKFLFTNPLTDDDLALHDYKLHNLALKSIPSEENSLGNQNHSNEEKSDEISSETSYAKKKKKENVKNNIDNIRGKYTISEKKSEEEEDEEFQKSLNSEYRKLTDGDFKKNYTIGDNIFERNYEVKSLYSKSKSSKKLIPIRPRKNNSNLSGLRESTQKKSSKFKPKTLLQDVEEYEINSEIENVDDKIRGINLAEYKKILPHEILKDSREPKNMVNKKFEENFNELISPMESKNLNKFSEISEKKEKLIYQPILYNVNIKNNYNLATSQQKNPSCSMCHSRIYPLSTNRIVVLLPIEDNQFHYKENLAWTNVQIAQNNSFEIKSEYNSCKNLKSFKTDENSSNVIPKIPTRSSFWQKKEQNLENNFINEEDRMKNASLKTIYENPLFKKKSSIESFHKQKNSLLGFRGNRMSIYEKLNLHNDSDGARTSSIPNHQNTDVDEKNFHRRNSKHMMTQIYKNIENNSLNLNDPQYFYSELLKSAMSKKKMVVMMKKMNERLDKMQNIILINSWKKG